MGWYRAAAVNNVILRKQNNTLIHPKFSFHSSFSNIQHSNQFCFNYSYKSYCTNETPINYLRSRKYLADIKFSNKLSKIPEIIKKIREPFTDNPHNFHHTCKIVIQHSVKLAKKDKNRYCHLAEAILQLYEELIPRWSYQAKRQYTLLMEPIIIHYRFFNYTHKVIELYQRCKLIPTRMHSKIIFHTLISINSPVHKDIILEIKDNVYTSKRKSKSIFDALYRTFRRLRMDREAKGVLNKMKAFGLSFTKRIYFMLIQDNRGNPSEVKNILNKMKENGVLPTIRHYTAVVDIQENITTEFVNDLLIVLEQENVTIDVYFFNKIIQKYLLKGELNNAIKIVRNLPNYGLEPSISTYTILMNHYAQVNDWNSFSVLLATAKKDNSKIDRAFMSQYIRLMNAHDKINLQSLMELMDIVAKNQISLKRKLLGEVAKCFKSTESLPELDFFLGYIHKIGICVTVEVINECLCSIVQRSDLTSFDVLRITHFIEKQDAIFEFNSNDIHLPLLYAVVKMNSGETMIQELFALANEKGIQINTKYLMFGLTGVTKNVNDKELLWKSLKKANSKSKNPRIALSTQNLI